MAFSQLNEVEITSFGYLSFYFKSQLFVFGRGDTFKIFLMIFKKIAPKGIQVRLKNLERP